MVGAITVSQKRLMGECGDKKKNTVSAYSAGKEKSLGSVCRGSVVDAKPYGVDPVFSSASSLYRGDLSITDFYEPSEISGEGLPYGM